jgi:hypothetical protein
MYDPPTSIGRILHLMTRCAGALHAATAYDPVQIPAASLVQVSQRCRYCNAIHVLARDMRCQNCGAPA